MCHHHIAVFLESPIASDAPGQEGCGHEECHQHLRRVAEDDAADQRIHGNRAEDMQHGIANQGHTYEGKCDRQHAKYGQDDDAGETGAGVVRNFLEHGSLLSARIVRGYKSYEHGTLVFNSMVAPAQGAYKRFWIWNGLEINERRMDGGGSRLRFFANMLYLVSNTALSAKAVGRMATLHLMIGLPCSGKTTYAKELSAKEHALLLTPDAWQLKLFGQDFPGPYHDKRHSDIESIMWEVAERVLSLGTSVILDFGCWARVERDDFRERAGKLGVRFKLHYMDVPYAELFRRLEDRNQNLPEGAFAIPKEEMEKFIAIFEPPTDDELA